MTHFFGLRSLRCFAPVLFALFVLAPRPASADAVVLVPPHAEPGVPEESIDRALEAVARALKVDGFNVVSAGQAGATAEAEQERRGGEFSRGEDPEHCVTPECAAEFQRLFDATFAVQTSLFREGDHLSSVTLVIVERADAYFSGSAPVEGGDVEAGVLTAYQEARKRQASGVGPWLSVDGTPKSARVYVDGAEFGHVPIARRRLAVGTHRVVVSADGYGTRDESVVIPARLDHEEILHVKLKPLEGAPRRKVADWIIGGALIAGGLVFVGSGVRDYMRDGKCVSHYENGSCSSRAEANTTSALKLGIGGGVALLGGAYLWWSPIGLAGQQSAHDKPRPATTGGTFNLRVRF